MKPAVSVNRPDAAWSDLAAPKAVTGALRRISAAARRRRGAGRGKRKSASKPGPEGITVLFRGASGTGKTLAAEVLAHDLGRALHRVDLSRVIGTYIGETEKNLSEVFDAAAKSGAVLLFDEADALFGKRTEVKDAHDRFANAQTNYLLQRIEQYDGLVILTTNVVGNLDHPAVISRFARIVDFDVPPDSE